MGGVGGVGGAGGGAGVAAVGPVGAAGGGAPAAGVASAGPANSPAAVISISPQGFHNNFISEVLAVENSTKTLADQLVAAAILDALSDDDKNDQNKGVVSALIVASAIQAYNNMSNVPGSVTSTAVPGTGISISISA